MSLEEDLFLHDHTLGRGIAALDKTLLALPIVPLTVSMEIIAEAAAYLFPELQLIGMRAVRAYHWLLLEEESLCLELEAAYQKSVAEIVEVEVTLRIQGKADGGNHPALVGTMLLAPMRPAPQPAAHIPLHDERRSSWQEEEIYHTGMFHGPTFQAITAVERCGSDGCTARMQNPIPRRFFASDQNPEFVAEPILLDAAGQLIGLWTLETLERGFVVFPYRLEKLEFFGAPLLPGETVTCQARCTLQEGERVLSDIELVDEMGDLRIRLTGWEDKRFHIPRELYQFILNPNEFPLSRRWDAPLASYPHPGRYRCHCVGEWGHWGSHAEFWETVLAHLVLTPRERKAWEARTGPNGRRRDWLLGRVAVKEAVISLLRDNFALSLAPADIEIAANDKGRPFVEHSQANWRLPAGISIQVSIAHSDGMVVAIAGVNEVPASPPSTSLGVGIDLEPLESEAESFADIAFTADEQRLLNALPVTLANGGTAGWSLRLWCAKEALGKALGCGLGGGLHNIVASHINSQDGVIRMKIRGTLAEQFPMFADKTIRVFTTIDDNRLVATVLDAYSLEA